MSNEITNFFQIMDAKILQIDAKLLSVAQDISQNFDVAKASYVLLSVWVATQIMLAPNHTMGTWGVVVVASFTCLGSICINWYKQGLYEKLLERTKTYRYFMIVLFPISVIASLDNSIYSMLSTSCLMGIVYLVCTKPDYNK